MFRGYVTLQVGIIFKVKQSIKQIFQKFQHLDLQNCRMFEAGDGVNSIPYHPWAWYIYLHLADFSW